MAPAKVGILSKDSPVDWAAAAPKSPAMEAVKVPCGQREINGGNPPLWMVKHGKIHDFTLVNELRNA